MYKDNYTQDGGLTFQSSSHAYDAPRLALGWRPNSNTSVRGSAGFSVAPAYINLLTNTPTPVANRNPPTYFTLTGNAGDVSPETAFGFDLGADRRIARDTVLSADVYETTLHNQFISTTALDGTYTPPVGSIYPNQPYPLYVSKTANLGLARYEGVELALHRDPVVGFGYKLQGSLQRGYAYALPSGIYATAAGPYTANLGVIPNVNFEPSGQGYNGLSMARVPYAQAYGELNGRTRTGGYGLVGITYYGNNNSYNVAPFYVVNASYRQPIGKHVSLLLAVQNVTNVPRQLLLQYLRRHPGAARQRSTRLYAEQRHWAEHGKSDAAFRSLTQKRRCDSPCAAVSRQGARENGGMNCRPSETVSTVADFAVGRHSLHEAMPRSMR